MNPNAKFTPGPWVAEFLPPASSAQWFVRAKAENASVCHVERGQAHSREQQAANARLIAAAPELLQALEDALGCLEPVGQHPPSRTDQAIKKAQAAIAKAIFPRPRAAAQAWHLHAWLDSRTT